MKLFKFKENVIIPNVPIPRITVEDLTNNITDKVTNFIKHRRKRTFEDFLVRALYASEHMEVEEKAKFIATAWKHKSKYYTMEY